MAARKRAAKKATSAEKAEVTAFDPGPDPGVDDLMQEPEVLAASTFPAPKDEFLGPKTMSRRIHDDQKAVRRLQERFGHTSNGIWNRPLADEVIAFQRENDLQVTGLVDRATWAALFDEQP